MNPQQAIGQYELLCQLTELMLQAADRGEWDQLIELEQRYRIAANTIRLTDYESMLDERSRQHMMRLIQTVLDNEEKIRNHTESRLRQLKVSMQSNRQEQRLTQAYGAR